MKRFTKEGAKGTTTVWRIMATTLESTQSETVATRTQVIIRNKQKWSKIN